MEIKGQTFADVYSQIRRELLTSDIVAPKGNVTREITHVTLIIENPCSRLAYHPLRRFSLPFAIAEAVLLFSDTSSLKAFAWANDRMRQFSDNGRTLYGAYGVRIKTALVDIVERLRLDKDTRQAILPIFRVADLEIVTKNVPCTLSLNFLLRKDKLELHTYMRSNDAVWGLPYDLFCFTTLQEVIANELGVEVGTYYHTATSLHVYARHFELLSSLDELIPVGFFTKYTLSEMHDLVRMYTHLVDGDIDFSQPTGYGDFGDILFAKALKKAGLEPDEQFLPAWSHPFTLKLFGGEI